MRRRDHTHIHLARRQRPDPQHFLILQSAQQFGLRAERHVADFVQKNRALIGEFEQPHLILRGPVNDPRTCPNSSLSNKRLDHRRAVQHHEPSVAPPD